MIIAHLPAGYITSKLLFPRFEAKCGMPYKPFLLWGFIGSIAPDLDILYFFFRDHILHHTHRFYSHYPVVWVSFFLIALLWLLIDNHRSHYPALSVIFFINAFIHLVLDTFTGEIYWFAKLGVTDKPLGIGQYLPWNEGYLEFFVVLWAMYLWQTPVIHALFARLDKYTE